jgi:hypothetical protein
MDKLQKNSFTYFTHNRQKPSNLVYSLVKYLVWIMQLVILSRIWVSHGGECEVGCLLGCNTVSSVRSLPTFQRYLLPPSSGPDYGGSKYLPPDYTALQPRRQPSSTRNIVSDVPQINNQNSRVGFRCHTSQQGLPYSWTPEVSTRSQLLKPRWS